MNRLLTLKIIAGAALILSMLAFILPIVAFDEIRISMSDLLSMSSDITELMEEFGASSELIREEMNSYFLFWIILFALPVLECLLMFVIKGKTAFIVGIAGTLVNNVMFFIFYDKISGTISLINEAISFWSMDMQIEIKTGTIVLWCACYGIAAAVSVFALLRGDVPKRMQGDFRPIREILPEEIPAAPRVPYEPSFREPSSRQLAEPDGLSRHSFPSAPGSRPEPEFYGGIIGHSGIYKGKVRLFSRQEILLIGTNDRTDDILLNTVFDGITYCEVFYDEADGEYYLRPRRAKGVFLKSGQPLGKGRVYCLPRGTVITIRDSHNEFELA